MRNIYIIEKEIRVRYCDSFQSDPKKFEIGRNSDNKKKLFDIESWDLDVSEEKYESDMEDSYKIIRFSIGEWRMIELNYELDRRIRWKVGEIMEYVTS